MSGGNLLDKSFWEEIARDLPELVDNPEGTAHLASLFAGKYLPALLRAGTAEARERVWLAFWSYLIARPTRRKPTSLSQKAADRLIADFQNALARRSVTGP